MTSIIKTYYRNNKNFLSVGKRMAMLIYHVLFYDVNGSYLIDFVCLFIKLSNNEPIIG